MSVEGLAQPKQIGEGEKKIIPNRPNLEGDDVSFVRFDPKTGVVTGTGHMRRDHIRAEQEAGGSIIETKWQGLEIGKHVIDHATGNVISGGAAEEKLNPENQRQRLLTEIRSRLIATDKYFTIDALDNIDQATQDKFRAYRKKLRDVAKLTDPVAMQKAMPDNLMPDNPRILGM